MGFEPATFVWIQVYTQRIFVWTCRDICWVEGYHLGLIQTDIPGIYICIYRDCYRLLVLVGRYICIIFYSAVLCTPGTGWPAARLALPQCSSPKAHSPGPSASSLPHVLIRVPLHLCLVEPYRLTHLSQHGSGPGVAMVAQSNM